MGQNQPFQNGDRVRLVSSDRLAVKPGEVFTIARCELIQGIWHVYVREDMDINGPAPASEFEHAA